MRNKLVHSCSVKIHVSGFDELLESIFCILLVVETFSLLKVVNMLEEVAVSWREVRWIWLMRQNCIALLAQLLKHVAGCCCGELGPFCWPMPAARIAVFSISYWFAEHTSLMQWFHQDTAKSSRSDGQQTASDHDLFFRCKSGFGKCFGASSWSNHWAGRHWLMYKIHFLSHVIIRSRNGLLWCRIREDEFFWFAVSSWGTHLA